MTPVAIIKQASADGVNLALSPAGTIKATGDGAAVNRWLPVIRQHKPGILAALQEAANDSLRHPAWRWLLHYAEGSVEVRFSPVVTHDAALAACPGAIAAEPIPNTPERKPTEADASRDRVLAMLADRPDTKYAVLVDNPDTDPVTVALGIRDVGTCEVAIPAAKFDAFLLLGLIDRYRGTVH